VAITSLTANDDKRAEQGNPALATHIQNRQPFIKRRPVSRNSGGRRQTPDKFPTATGGIARLAYEQAKAAGVDPRQFLARAKLTLQQITAARVRIPVKAQIEFLDLIAQVLHDEFLGMRLAQKVDLREIGLLFYVLASSAKLNDALMKVARFSGLNNEGVRVSYQAGKGSITFHHVGISRLSDVHQIEFFVTILLRLCRHLVDRQLVPDTIKLMHHRTGVPSDMRSFFGSDIKFGSKVDEIVFSKTNANKPIVSADPYLNLLLEKFCDETILNRQTISGNWRLKVENAIAKLLPHGQAKMPEVCRELGMSSRTLSRRLTSEGQSFEKVLDALRSGLAQRYLREPDLTISEIAWLLGYRQISSFDHAFKRWTGKMPTDVRGRTKPCRLSQSPR
jgi:AraC-like DNA-binding protein